MQLHHGDSVIKLHSLWANAASKQVLCIRNHHPLSLCAFPFQASYLTVGSCLRWAPWTVQQVSFSTWNVLAVAIFFRHLGAEFEQANVKTGGQETIGQLSTQKNFRFSSADTCSERILVQPAAGWKQVDFFSNPGKRGHVRHSTLLGL